MPCATIILHPHVETKSFVHKRILVPLDGSPLAEKALDPALALAEVILLRVTTRSQIHVKTMPGWPGLDAVMEAAEQKTYATLQRVRASLADSPVTIKVCSATGPVAESIADIAESQQVDLIIMCRHGRSGIERWVFGSVAEKVLRGANIIMRVIRGKEVSK